MEENVPQLSSAFPPPPPYYKFFTAENLHLLSSQTESSAEKKNELQYLVPPPAPVEGSYSTFGDTWPVPLPPPHPPLLRPTNCFKLPERLRSLTELGVQQLYPSEPHLDRTAELRTLTRSALMNYLELVGILGLDPAGWVEKIDDLRIIFVNMHHLLNEYRPHQVCPPGGGG
jgi:mediator of RNA polymerase II transcription subunit 7